MALSKAVKNARHSGQTITWKKDDGTAYDLTGATITARIRDQGSNRSRAADGTFAIVTAASGIFTWAYGAVDVGTPGKFWVQFIATYSDSKNDKSYWQEWVVEDAI